jgi:hypothetical protein
MTPISRRTVLGLPLLALAACAGGPPPRPAFAEPSFAQYGPLTFDALRFEVRDEYVPPLKAPNVEHEMPLRPAAAAVRWANDRIRIGGRTARTVFVRVRRAPVIETDLRKTTGLRGLLTTDQAQRYDAELEVAVELVSAAGQRDGHASALVRRSVTVPENISINGRDRVLHGLVEQLMADLNGELERNIRVHLGAFML